MTPPRPKSRLAPAMIVAGVLMALVLYPGSYLGLGNLQDGYRMGVDPPSTITFHRLRRFDYCWQCKVYAPLGWVESKVKRSYVELIVDSKTYAEFAP